MLEVNRLRDRTVESVDINPKKIILASALTSRNTENENKRCKIFNKVLNMNWDYVRGKKNQKENKNKQTKRKQTNKNK